MATKLKLLDEVRWWARAAMATGGVTFSGKRDLYTVLGYSRVLTAEDFRDRYERGGIAKSIIEAKPEDTWRGGAEIIEDENPEVETAFETEFLALAQRLKLWPKLQRLDILAGIGHFGILLIGAPGPMEMPLEKASADDIKFLAVYAEDDVTIERLDTDPTSPRFGWPLYYVIRRKSPNMGRTTSSDFTRRVHHSRVIHVADGVVDHDAWGTPRLQAVWNRLDDLDKITGGGSEAFWRRADQGVQFDLDPTIQATPEQLAQMREEVEKYVHGYQRILRTRGVEVKSLGSDVANLEGPAKTVLEQIAATIRIPLRVLMGSEQAKLAAEQDSVNYFQRIEARRVDFAESMIVRPLLDRFIELGALSEPEQYEVRWSQLKTRDDDERLTLAAKATQANSTNSSAGGPIITVDEIRTRILDLPPMQEVGGEDDEDSEEDTAPTTAETPTWKDVQQAADKTRKSLQKSVRGALDAARRVIVRDVPKAETAQAVLEVADEAILLMEDRLQVAITRALKAVVAASGNAAAARIRKAVQVKDLRAAADDAFTFDKTNPKAVQWVTRHAAETISGISKTTREDIREAVEEAFTEQRTVDELAKDIADIIGDDERAEVIARTETMRASNAGQELAWEQAKDDGLLTGNEKKEWIVTPDDRLCPVCEPMDGVQVPLGESFSVNGEQLDGPPAHPNCRCAMGLSLS
jgi:hypothetical protein